MAKAEGNDPAPRTQSERLRSIAAENARLHRKIEEIRAENERLAERARRHDE